jgi:hypothetical protein
LAGAVSARGDNDGDCEDATMTTQRPRGPAAYFPSIEKRYGHSIAAWKTDLAGTGLTTYKELMAWLKEGHGFGHGGEKEGRRCLTSTLH